MLKIRTVPNAATVGLAGQKEHGYLPIQIK